MSGIKRNNTQSQVQSKCLTNDNMEDLGEHKDTNLKDSVKILLGLCYWENHLEEEGKRQVINSLLLPNKEIASNSIPKGARGFPGFES